MRAAKVLSQSNMSSKIELSGHKRVVARALALTGLAIDFTVQAQVCDRFGGIDMIDPPTDVPLESVWDGEVPEREVPWTLSELAEHVAQAKIENGVQSRELIRVMPNPAEDLGRVENIFRKSGNVDITQPNEGFI